RHYDRPGVWLPHCYEDTSTGSEHHNPAHALIHATEGMVGPGFGLRCSHPLEQVAACYTHAVERPADRIAHQPCLMRQQPHRQRYVRRGIDQVRNDRTRVTAFRNPAAMRNETDQEG